MHDAGIHTTTDNQDVQMRKYISWSKQGEAKRKRKRTKI